MCIAHAPAGLQFQYGDYYDFCNVNARVISYLVLVGFMDHIVTSAFLFFN